jgi:transcriptional regulator GlxA family with amidase domain
MRIGLLVQDGFFGSAVASILDIMAIAEVVRPQLDPSIPVIEMVIAGPRRRVTSGSGLTITTSHTLRELDDLDVVEVPALGTITGPDTEAAIESPAGRAAVRALARIDPSHSRIAAACTGVFALAETGLLDGRRVTTSWFLTPTFRVRYPLVSVDLDSMVVADGPILTAGAAFAHIDLALAILRGMSADLTDHVARLLLIDERPSQTGFVSYDHLEHTDTLVMAFERHVRERLHEPFDGGRAAREIGTSRRTLERRTRQALGLSPLEIVQRLRIERATHLRRSTDLATDEIARRVGYANGETLRALERRTRNRPNRTPRCEPTVDPPSTHRRPTR